MPELCEVEQYRRLAERVVGRMVARVEVRDPRFLQRGLRVGALRAAVVGRRVTAARRHGKVLLLDCEGGAGRHVLGVRFGMTGRLLVDGDDVVGPLVYGPTRDEEAWDRVLVRFDGPGDAEAAAGLRVRDARRLGGVELDPDLSRLGPDVLAASPSVLAERLAGTARPVKAVLLDQAVMAGVGNLLADEILYRAGVAPQRRLESLDAAGRDALAATIPDTVADLLARGGSHRGDLQPSRRPGGTCPIDGTLLRRSTVGGRTSWWCPRHQR